MTIDFEDWAWNPPFVRCKNKKREEDIQWMRTEFLNRSVDELKRAEILSQSLFKRSIPQILLLHIGDFDSVMLKELIQAYKAAGVEFISMSEALKDEVYQIDTGMIADVGSEITYQILKSRNLKLEDVGLSKRDNTVYKKLEQACL